MHPFFARHPAPAFTQNVAAAIFWLKARGGWREKQEIELSAEPPEQKPIDSIVTTDPIEAARIYQQIMQGDG